MDIQNTVCLLLVKSLSIDRKSVGYFICKNTLTELVLDLLLCNLS